MVPAAPRADSDAVACWVEGTDCVRAAGVVTVGAVSVKVSRNDCDVLSAPSVAVTVMVHVPTKAVSVTFKEPPEMLAATPLSNPGGVAAVSQAGFR